MDSITDIAGRTWIPRGSNVDGVECYAHVDKATGCSLLVAENILTGHPEIIEDIIFQSVNAEVGESSLV